MDCPFLIGRRDKGVKCKSFVLRDTDTGTGFGADSFVLLLGGLRGVDIFFKSTVLPFWVSHYRHKGVWVKQDRILWNNPDSIDGTWDKGCAF